MSKLSDAISQLSPLQQALLGLRELRSKLDAITREPIAVVGMACRFPGGVSTPEEFWKLLSGGVDAIQSVPPSRWDIDAYYDADPDAPGKMYTRCGGFIDEVDLFDPLFFGIAPREAAAMDPQQRILLEVAWEAFERAGLAPEKVRGSQTGVFVGITSSDYAFRQRDAIIDAYAATGNSHSVAVGRLSYLLGLQGPSIALDTACSSSLVTTHLACQALRNRECDMALAGGVNLILSPVGTITFCRARMMARDGRCKTFDASADGYVRGEGCGLVVLKRLSDARADRDNIIAVIRGSAVNQDGASGGLTVPSGPAQEAVIRKALAAAGVDPRHVSYVEAHGTGTPLGDPIEIRALTSVLGKDRPENDPLLVGSVKTNIGHLESAAGIAGLMKVALALQHAQIPPHLHLKQLNPYIAWHDAALKIPTELTPWSRPDGELRRAGVSSFSFNGTNAHIVLEEAPPAPASERSPDRPVRPLHILTLSAKTEQAQHDIVARYLDYLKSNPSIAFGDLCFTANTGRSHFPYRMAVVADSIADVQAQLSVHAAGQRSARLQTGQRQDSSSVPVVFLFTGQGSQYAGMGRELYETQPAFRDTLNRCDELLSTVMDRRLLSVFYPKADEISPIDNTAYTQPALFALEYALAQLWKSWGVEPAAVIGHSVGEYVAACVAGVFTLEEGLKLIAERGRLMQALPGRGRMAAVMADETLVRSAVAGHREHVSIAAVNGPTNIVISGAGDAVEAILAELDAQGIMSQDLQVSHAFHSPLIEPMLAEFERALSSVEWRHPRIAFMSNLTGSLIEGDALARPDYWLRHAREAVQFDSGIRTLQTDGYRVFLEIGPAPVLTRMGSKYAGKAEDLWLASLRNGRSDWEQILETLSRLYVSGVNVNWMEFDRGYDRRKLVLPTYPFQRERYWIAASDAAADQRPPLQSISPALHPLLGSRLRSAMREEQFESFISSERFAYLSDHRVFGRTLFPAAGFLEVALAAARAVGIRVSRLTDVAIAAPLELDEKGRTLQLIVKPRPDGCAAFELYSTDLSQAPPNKWSLHLEGVMQSTAAELRHAAPGDPVRAGFEEMSIESFYAAARARGFEYGPSFHGIERLWRRDGEMFAKIQLPGSLIAEAASYQIHPALLDAALQVLMAIQTGSALDETFLPVGLEQFQLQTSGQTQFWVHAALRASSSTTTVSGDIRLFDDDARCLGALDGVAGRRVSREMLENSRRPDLNEWLYEVQWYPRPHKRDHSGEAPGEWLIVCDEGGVGRQVAALLQAVGEKCEIVSHGRRLHTAKAYKAVVHLESLNATEEDPTADELNRAQRAGAQSLLLLVQSLARHASTKMPRLWVVTENAQAVKSEQSLRVAQAPVWGLSKVIALEHPELRCVRVDLDRRATRDEKVRFLFDEIVRPGDESEVALREGRRYVSRLNRARPITASSGRQVLQMQTMVRGVLDSLEMRPAPHRRPGPGEIEIRVRAAGLNFLDVMNGLGALPFNVPGFGAECSGEVVAIGEGVKDLGVGDAVVAMTSGALSTFVTTTAQAAYPKPPRLTFEEAATIPIAFMTALYALRDVAGMRPGSRILIHAASGGVGLAAVQLGQKAGAEIFATAGNAEKREFLRSLGIRHVMNSRSTDFAEEIMRDSDGEGVDIVLNSLTGDFIAKGLQVLCGGGHFVEIGKTEVWSQDQVAKVRSDVHYQAIALDRMAAADPLMVRRLLHDVMEDFQAGRLQVTRYQSFPVAEAAHAFRHMAQAKHIGKIVLCLPDDPAEPISEQPLTLKADGTYLIAGGLGALGLQVAGWMIENGARNLVLAGRRGPSVETAERIRKWEAAGVRVVIGRADISNEAELQSMLAENVEASPSPSGRGWREAPGEGDRDDKSTLAHPHPALRATFSRREKESPLPPLRGVIHAAGILDDGVLLQQTWERCERVMAPKVNGAWNLHKLTLDQPLEFFVVFSSAASMLGSPGQANYAAANAFLDALAHHRHGLGLPAMSINWGAWSGTGMASGVEAQFSRSGLDAIAPAHGLQVFERLLGQNRTQIAVMPIRWSTFLQQFSPRNAPAFLELLARDSARLEASPSAISSEFLRRLERTSSEERRELIAGYVGQQVAKVLGIDATRPLDRRRLLTELGMDSLMAVELRNHLQAGMNLTLPPAAVVDHPTIESLAEYLVREFKSAAPAADVTPADIDLNVEGVLDPSIVPSGEFDASTPIRSVFLTGATGYLGGNLLRELLSSTDFRVYCLIRPGEALEPKKRLSKKLEELRLSDAVASRAIAVEGDLTKPLLGLSRQRFEQLAVEVDSIYHSGADVNFVLPYSELKASAVGGTQEVLRLASVGKPKPVHHISSTAVFVSADLGMKGSITENIELRDVPAVSVGYVQVKWVSEKLVAAARDRGMPVCIYRPAFITGHSRTGECKLDDLIPLMMQGCVQMRSAPVLKSFALDFMPVDWLSRTVVQLSARSSSLGRAFNTVHPERTSWNRVIELMREYGYSIRQVSYEKWLAELKEESRNNLLRQMLPFFEGTGDGGFWVPPLSIENTREVLSSVEIIPARDLFRTYLDSFVRIGFLPAPNMAARS